MATIQDLCAVLDVPEYLVLPVLNRCWQMIDGVSKEGDDYNITFEALKVFARCAAEETLLPGIEINQAVRRGMSRRRRTVRAR